MVYAEYSARSGSFPPSGATNGYFAAPLAANLYDSSFTNSANAHATSCTKLGKLIGPRVTWNTALVSGPPPTMSMCTTALILGTKGAPFARTASCIAHFSSMFPGSPEHEERILEGLL